MGGQSAFGAKAGDVFTKITIGVAAFWILLCIVAVNVLGRQQSLLSGDLGGSAPITLDETLDAGDSDAAAPAGGEAGNEDAEAVSNSAEGGGGAASETAAEPTTEAPAESSPAGE